jgi:hypothetical protein
MVLTDEVFAPDAGDGGFDSLQADNAIVLALIEALRAD